MDAKRNVKSPCTSRSHGRGRVKGKVGGVVGNICRDRAGQGLKANRTCYSRRQLRAATAPGHSFLLSRASAVGIAGAMPFGHHHQSGQNDPAQGIYAAASALGSM